MKTNPMKKQMKTNPIRTHRFPVGTAWSDRKKRLNVISDRLTTTNDKGEVVRLDYVSESVVLGQIVRSYNVTDSEIARALMRDQKVSKFEELNIK